MNDMHTFYRDHVNAKWPKPIPVITEAEAISAVKRLYRKFMGRKLVMPIIITSGRNYTYIRSGGMRINPGNGWRDIVHNLAHSFGRRLYPGYMPHSTKHAYLERDMVDHVIASGWLDGRLKSKAKPKPATRTLDHKHKLVLASIERWEAKERRAKSALRKLRIKDKYYTKKLAL